MSDQAILTELGRRTRQKAEERALENEIANMRQGSCAKAQSTRPPQALFLLKYREDNGLIENEARDEEVGVRKPTPNENRIASRTKSNYCDDSEAVKNLEREIQWHQSVERTARCRKRQQKRDLRGYTCALEPNNARPDPPSDRDDALPVV